MSASGPTRKSAAVSVRSVLLPGPDTVSRTGDVRKVPEQTSSYSITSSARRTSAAGISCPIDFAVLRLTTSSKLVGCSIGWRNLRLASLFS